MLKCAWQFLNWQSRITESLTGTETEKEQSFTCMGQQGETKPGVVFNFGLKVDIEMGSGLVWHLVSITFRSCILITILHLPWWRGGCVAQVLSVWRHLKLLNVLQDPYSSHNLSIISSSWLSILWLYYVGLFCTQEIYCMSLSCCSSWSFFHFVFVKKGFSLSELKV